MPAWLDSEAYKELSKLGGLKYLEMLKRGEYFNEAEKDIIARFDSIGYVIS